METKSCLELQGFYPKELKITKVIENDRSIVIYMKSQKHSHCCVKCEEEMHVYHAPYVRTVQDLPIFHKNVMLKITAYSYFCSDDNCDTKTFAEDYGKFIGRSGRMTDRLEDFVQTLAMETSREGAAAICKKMGIRINGDTAIRLLRKMGDSAPVLSGDTIVVDDFA